MEPNLKDKYTILLPIVRQAVDQRGLLDITKSSPQEHLEALEQLALYFKREFKYSGLQFNANEHVGKHIEYHGFVFTEPAHGAMREEDSEVPTRFLGGGCFRKREFTEGEIWCLDWVWIHPYARNKGLFTRQIEYFKEEFGDFLPEPPLSKTMKHIFFNKVRVE